ncbi:MAG: hypothetical protein E5V21_23880, partial [Mesorhizobium sp.]
MDIDIFKDILVPVIGGLGIFMLGLDFMANGIQALSVNRMRAFLERRDRLCRIRPGPPRKPF